MKDFCLRGGIALGLMLNVMTMGLVVILVNWYCKMCSRCMGDNSKALIA